jgi:hypothetical protein
MICYFYAAKKSVLTWKTSRKSVLSMSNSNILFYFFFISCAYAFSLMFQHDLVWEIQRYRARVSKSRKLFWKKSQFYDLATSSMPIFYYYNIAYFYNSIIQYSRLSYSSMDCGAFTFKHTRCVRKQMRRAT